MADFINIRFPFKDSTDGNYVTLNKDSDNAIKSDLIHLLLTQKGERFYLPDFGTNLKRHIFNQKDSITLSEIKAEIDTAIQKYMPNLRVTQVNVVPSETENLTAIVTIDYIVTDDVFQTNDSVSIEL